LVVAPSLSVIIKVELPDTLPVTAPIFAICEVGTYKIWLLLISPAEAKVFTTIVWFPTFLVEAIFCNSAIIGELPNTPITKSPDWYAAGHETIFVKL